MGAGAKKEGGGYLQTIESEGIVGTESHADKSFRFGRKAEAAHNLDKRSVVSNGDIDDLASRLAGVKVAELRAPSTTSLQDVSSINPYSEDPVVVYQ